MQTATAERSQSLWSDISETFDQFPELHSHTGDAVVFPDGADLRIDSNSLQTLRASENPAHTAARLPLYNSSAYTIPSMFVAGSTVQATMAPGARFAALLGSAAVQELSQTLHKLVPNRQILWFGRLKQQLYSLWGAAFVRSADQQLFRRAHCVGGYTHSKGIAVALHVQVLSLYLTEKQICWACILHRENCLKALRWQLKEFASAQRSYNRAAAKRPRPAIGVDHEWETIRRGFRARIRTLLLSLLKLTVQFIEHLSNWRKALWRPRPFFFRGGNYAQKIAFDTQWLARSNIKQTLREINVPRDELDVCSMFSCQIVWSSTTESQMNVQDWKIMLQKATAVGNLPADGNILSRIAEALSSLSGESVRQRKYQLELEVLSKRNMYIPMLRWRLQDPGDGDVESALFRRKAAAEREARARLNLIRAKLQAQRTQSGLRGCSNATPAHSTISSSKRGESSHVQNFDTQNLVEKLQGNELDCLQMESESGLDLADLHSLDEYAYYGAEFERQYPSFQAAAARTTSVDAAGGAYSEGGHWAGGQYSLHEPHDKLPGDKEERLDLGDGSFSQVSHEARPAQLPEDLLSAVAGESARLSSATSSDNDDVVPAPKVLQRPRTVARKAPCGPAPPEARAHRRFLPVGDTSVPASGNEGNYSTHAVAAAGTQSTDLPTTETHKAHTIPNEWHDTAQELQNFDDPEFMHADGVEGLATDDAGFEAQYDEWGGCYDQWGGYTDADGVYYEPAENEEGLAAVGSSAEGGAHDTTSPGDHMSTEEYAGGDVQGYADEYAGGDVQGYTDEYGGDVEGYAGGDVQGYADEYAGGDVQGYTDEYAGSEG